MLDEQIKNKVGVLNLDYLHKMYADMPVNTKNLKQLLGDSSDIIFECLEFGKENGVSATLVFAEGLIDTEKASESVIRPLNLNPDVRTCENQNELLDMINVGKIYAPSSVHAAGMDELLILLFSGTCALILDDIEVGILFTAGGTIPLHVRVRGGKLL